MNTPRLEIQKSEIPKGNPLWSNHTRFCWTILLYEEGGGSIPLYKTVCRDNADITLQTILRAATLSQQHVEEL